MLCYRMPVTSHKPRYPSKNYRSWTYENPLVKGSIEQKRTGPHRLVERVAFVANCKNYLHKETGEIGER